MTLKYYPANGKLYDNDVYQHDLAPEKVYPAKYYNWACQLGHDSRGTYFLSGTARYYKTK